VLARYDGSAAEEKEQGGRLEERGVIRKEADAHPNDRVSYLLKTVCFHLALVPSLFSRPRLLPDPVRTVVAAA